MCWHLLSCFVKFILRRSIDLRLGVLRDVWPALIVSFSAQFLKGVLVGELVNIELIGCH